MLFDRDMDRYRWLRVLLGALVTVAVVVGLTVVIFRWVVYWSPPGVVQIPQAPGVSVALQDHPRLVATVDAIEALSENTESPEHLRILRKADQFYDEYLIDPLQGDTIYPGYFALAWRISGEERYLDAARDMVLNVCRFPEWRRRPESSNFYKIELGYAVGLAYDLLYDQFTERERARIEENLSEVLDGFLWHLQGNPSEPFWYNAPHSNYYVAQNSAAGLLALCLGDAYPRWQDALAYGYDGLQPSIELLERDGGWIEGLTYLDFCWGQHAHLFLNALRVNGGPNRLDEDWYETSVRFALAGILPSGQEQVNFGDNITDPIASFGYLWRARAFFDSDFLDGYLGQYLEEPDYPRVPLDALLVQAILEFDPSLPLREFQEPEPCQYFPGIEWTMLREDWTDPDGFFLAAKAGYGGWDHNHVDQGTFILAFDGEVFIADPGRGIFSERRDPAINNVYAGPTGHSVFVPFASCNRSEDACYWNDFTMYSENAQYRQADAEIVDWVDTAEFTSFRMILDGAYPSEGLTRWRRHFVWRKPSEDLPGGIVLIFDEADVGGQVRFVSHISPGERPGGQAWEDAQNRLGVIAVQPEDVVDYSTTNRVLTAPGGEQYLSMLVLDDPDGLTQVLTVLLPYDNDGIRCEVYSTDNTIGAFVDGHQFEFIRDDCGDWSFVSSF